MLLAGCASTPLEKRSWLEVRSANFTIFTNLPQAKAVALSEELEIFRALVSKLSTLTGAKRIEPRVPTRIFAFAGAHEFQNFAPDYSTRGYFRQGLRENIVALDASSSRGMDARTIMFHEYTHFLVHNQNDIALPLWYDEGFAEFLGTTRIDEKTVFIGAAPTYRRANALWSDPHTTETIVRARNFERLGRRADLDVLSAVLAARALPDAGPQHGDQNVGGKAASYMKLLDQGHDDEAAFEVGRSTWISTSPLRELNRYNELPKIPALNLPRALFATEKGTRCAHCLRPRSPCQLGFLALSVGRFDLAEGYFNRATSLEPNCARAYAGLGIVEQYVRGGELARPDFERALELAPDDYENHLEFAEWIHETAEQEQRPSQLAEAREHYQRAIELAPQVPEGHAMLGRTYVMTQEDPLPGIQRARARAHAVAGTGRAADAARAALRARGTTRRSAHHGTARGALVARQAERGREKLLAELDAQPADGQPD